METTYNIVIVDDHRLFAEGLERILMDEPDFSLQGIYSNGNELLHHLNSKKPNLVMLDIQMAGIDGLELCKKIKSNYTDIKVILISMFESNTIINEAKNNGADGYIPKTTDASMMKKTIHDILEGSPVYLRPIAEECKEENSSLPNFHLISKRERDIIKLIKKGYTSKDMADELNISQYTVETHRKNILKKLNLKSVKDLIGLAYEYDL
ncbi:response regulator transcription factor [Flavobacterium alkalisoli]|uniref:Response regulator transcription factor n=1 Tax=Flavobacterium alkalisoli TaxID=2602769 RepID=A0A5B9G141_9FLAO|nr:response regulator transcription factor [Flavobacterium alkalisoli]QEE50727.1 response regulator transcription factor [Flavobacterium alkalisoli]